jgi:hypothetical protein
MIYRLQGINIFINTTEAHGKVERCPKQSKQEYFFIRLVLTPYLLFYSDNDSFFNCARCVCVYVNLSRSLGLLDLYKCIHYFSK